MLLTLYTGISFASFCINSWSVLTGVFCKSPAIDMLGIEFSFRVKLRPAQRDNNEERALLIFPTLLGMKGTVPLRF